MRLPAILAAVALLTAGCGTETEQTATAPTVHKAAGPRQVSAMAPLPKAHPRLVQPRAGQTTQLGSASAGTKATSESHTSLPKPTGPATDTKQGALSDPNAHDLSATKATALANGVALPPLQAPEQVLDVIRAGNIIARTPYKWGGGHGRFKDNGYDCSGSVSYALYYAGLINGPHVAAELMGYGKPGPGKWITIYASPTHVYMTVAGIRFDTRAQRSNAHDSRWINQLADNKGFEARHPAGL